MRITSLAAAGIFCLFGACAFAEPVLDVSVHWDKKAFTAGRDAYSLNAFHGFNPEIPPEPLYQKGIAYINPGALRYHAGSVVNDSRTSAKGWLNHETRSWDVEKIKRATAHWPKPTPMITISYWPTWMTEGEERLLGEEYYDDYAALCADLVRIINVELGLGVKLWEPMNERELAYVRALERAGKKPRFDQLIDIYNRCAVAMKKADPTIQVGGPAISNASWTDLIRRFARGARDNIDFFSVHHYVTSNAERSDEFIFDAAQEFGPRIARLIAILEKEIPDRHVPVVLDEFNINWTWHTKDPRMQNHKGAIFDALVMSSVISSGGAATYAWNDFDAIYGKMAWRTYELLPAAHVYHYLNGHFVGDGVAVTTADQKQVVPYAVIEPTSGRRALMLVNRSENPVSVQLRTTGTSWPANAVLTQAVLSEEGLTTSNTSRAAIDGQAALLPAFSITFFVETSPAG